MLILSEPRCAGSTGQFGLTPGVLHSQNATRRPLTIARSSTRTTLRSAMLVLVSPKGYLPTHSGIRMASKLKQHRSIAAKRTQNILHDAPRRKLRRKREYERGSRKVESKRKDLVPGAIADIKDLDLKDKPVAVFGLGDSAGYGDNFCDAIEEIHDAFSSAGAKMIGYVPTEEYQFEASKAVRDGKFLGLPLDANNEDDLTEERVKAWTAQLVAEGMNA